MRKKLLSLLALPVMLAAPSQSAQAQDLSGMSEEDISVIVRFMLPSAFDQVQDVCQPHLPSDSYVYAQGDALAERFEASAEGTMPTAIELFMKMSGSENPEMTQAFAQMPPEILGPFVQELVGGMIAQEITPESCSPINRVLELLDPMPPENSADLIAFLVLFVQEQEAKEAAKGDG